LIIGLLGFEGSGKDTVASILVNEYGFTQRSFADPVKDVCAAVFQWPRELLEGKTAESREWRETVDPWWSEHLGIPSFTPRYAMRYIGTDLFRNCFSDTKWIKSLEKNLYYVSNDNIVVSDVRFKNEMSALKNSGAEIFLVTRGEMPVWYDDAIKLSASGQFDQMHIRHMDIHQSNWDWISHEPDYKIIDNNGSLSDLTSIVKSIVK
jgi:hypothetical protein